MLNSSSNVEKSVNPVARKQNRHNLKDQQWWPNLLKLVAITMVIVTLAIVSVSDGQLLFSRLDTKSIPISVK